MSKGIEIIEHLRGHTSGLAVPTFVVDAPGGGGKIPVSPTYLISQSHNKVALRNYEGVISVYTEPDDYKSEWCSNCSICDCKEKTSIGVSSLLRGEAVSIEPKCLQRKDRGHAKPR